MTESSLSYMDIVVTSARRRLIPVLATAITDAVGFIPMAISTGMGSEVLPPLAVVVAFGLLSSTFLTLFLILSLYERFAPKAVVEDSI